MTINNLKMAPLLFTMFFSTASLADGESCEIRRFCAIELPGGIGIGCISSRCEPKEPRVAKEPQEPREPNEPKEPRERIRARDFFAAPNRI